MDDLISRKAAIEKFEPWLKVDGYSEGELNMLKVVLYELRFLPSAQSDIIRCKDCRFYKFKQGSLPWNHSRRYCNRSVSLSTQENDYCSYAELRGEQE